MNNVIFLPDNSLSPFPPLITIEKIKSSGQLQDKTSAVTAGNNKIESSFTKANVEDIYSNLRSGYLNVLTSQL